MTVPSENRKAGPYAGNGITTVYPFDFKLFSVSDLRVVHTDPSGVETTLVLSSDYSATLNADQGTAPGGSVTLSSPLQTGHLLTLVSGVPNTQTLDLTNQGGFYPRVINAAFDRATMQIQQLAEEMGRSVRVPVSSDLDPADYLDVAARSAAAASAAASSAADSAIAAAAAESGSETARNEAVTAAAAITLPLPIESGGTGATTQKEARANLGVMDGPPVGSLLFQSVRETHVQPGYILGNGAPVTETYPELRALYIADGYPYGQDGYGNPLTPDYGGYHLRGWLPGQVIDSGRVWGSKQKDALQGHKHRTALGAAKGIPAEIVDGSEDTTSTTYTSSGTGTYYRALTGGADYSDGIHGTPRAADETRGKNITTIVWIKAYAANTDPGSIDLAELANDIGAVSVRATALENRLGYTVLYPSGTETAPATISNNQRVAIANPYGNAPCLVEAEIKRGDAWGITGWYADNAGSSDGARASVLGEQIVIQSGSRSVCHNSAVAGNGFGLTGAVTSAPYRVKVWKLAGAGA